MKDLYSFHADQNDLDSYYEKVAEAYGRIFKRTGVKAIRTFASGGLFSKFSDEFQVPSEIGEDTIYINKEKDRAVNKEVYSDEVLADLNWDKNSLVEKTAIEVGNIFKLGTKFSVPLGLNYADVQGNKQPVVMASYGIGPGRLMGTVVEVSNDAKGIIWPESIAPYKVHLIVLDDKKEESEKVYRDLTAKGIEVLYDDRDENSAGEKFADADLIGCPVRIVISNKTLDKNSVEIKERNKKELKLIKLSDVISTINE